MSNIINQTFLLIGGNLGDRLINLLEARQQIESKIGEVAKASSVYETAAWGVTEQPRFLNQVLLVNTNLSAQQVMAVALDIEQNLGRIRSSPMAPRTMDIDILFYNDAIINDAVVTIPHPRIAERRFVLVPICEIADYYVHPVLKKPISELLITCPDTLPVHLI